MKTEAAILRRLGPIPFWRGEKKCVDALQRIYRKAMESARQSLNRPVQAALVWGLVAFSCLAAARQVPQPAPFEPKTRVEKAAFAVLEKYSAKELREIQGFFAPVVKKWTPVGEKFASEYLAAKNRNAVLTKYLPQARKVLDEARAMKVPPRYEPRRDQYVTAAEALYTAVSLYLQLDGKLKGP